MSSPVLTPDKRGDLPVVKDPADPDTPTRANGRAALAAQPVSGSSKRTESLVNGKAHMKAAKEGLLYFMVERVERGVPILGEQVANGGEALKKSLETKKSFLALSLFKAEVKVVGNGEEVRVLKQPQMLDLLARPSVGS